jgi:hypothetical protein
MIPDNLPTEKRKITLGQFLKALNLFSTYRPVLQTRGNPDKQRKIFLLLSRIFHLTTLTIIPLAIIAITVIFPWKNITPHLKVDADVNAIISICYIFSIIATIIGYKWWTIHRWLNKHTNMINQFTFGDYYLELYSTHNLRIGNFVVVTAMAFLIGITDNSLYFGLPLFVLAAIALALTYPTDKKWAKWLVELESNDHETDN